MQCLVDCKTGIVSLQIVVRSENQFETFRVRFNTMLALVHLQFYEVQCKAGLGSWQFLRDLMQS